MKRLMMVWLLLAAISAHADSTGSLSAHAWYRMFDHSVQVTLDYSGDASANYGGGSLSAVLFSSDGRELGRATATHMPTHLLGIPLAQPLPDGDYVVKAAVVDAFGAAHAFNLPFTRKKSTWEDNGIGVTDKIISPWTPMTVSGRQAACWGRIYTFGTLGLPSQIHSTQPEPSRGAATKDLLASPVSLVVDTPNGRLRWKRIETLVKQRTEGYVDVTASAATTDGELRASLSGTLEFDGFYKFTLKIEPTGPVAVNSMVLEVPLPDDIGMLLNVNAENMRGNNAFLDLEGKPQGELWNSYNAFALQQPYLSYKQKVAASQPSIYGGYKRGDMGPYYPAHPVIGNFYPHIWLGDDDRGIAFLADNDQGWVQDYTKPCQDVIRKDGKTILRLLIVNSPATISKPIETTLSLQATPVKPRPAGGSWKQWHTYGWSQFDKPHIYDNCFEPYKQGGGDKWYTSEEARKEDRWWRYFCFYSDRMEMTKDCPTNVPTTEYQPDWATHKEEWNSGSVFGWYGPCSVHTSGNADWRLWCYKQWHDITGMKGLYYDNTFPQIVSKPQTGIAWEDDFGGIHPGFACFSARDYIKRVRTYFLEQGPAPVIYTHMTDAPIIGYLGFADMWLDGENGGRPDYTLEQEAQWGAKLDFVDRWGNPGGLANLRITLGRQWGVVPTYLYTWGTDPTYTVLGMFGLDNCYTAVNKVDYKFGLDQADCTLITYWDKRKFAQVVDGGMAVLATTWTRPGRARVLISNLFRYDRTVDVKLDLKSLGLPRGASAVDEQTGEAVNLRDGTIRGLTVARHNYRAVLIAAPGVFNPIPTAQKSLAPKERIEPLCDTFDSIGSAWKRQGKNIDTWHGMLRITGNAFEGIVRPFGEDNCSVQARMMVSGGFWDSSPQIALYWDKDTYVRIKPGGLIPIPNGPNVQSFATAAGKEVGHGDGPTAGAVNWVKITLKPQAIEFYYSTDGKGWTMLNTVPRAGFDGSPKYLFVGRLGGLDPQAQAPGTDRAMGTVYIDDLVVGRE